MPIEILMPALSPTMKEGNLARWLKKEGDKIKAGEVIAEIETDKATMEVEAVDEGILGKIIIAEGTENVAVNSLIALILEKNEDINNLKDYQSSNQQLELNNNNQENHKKEDDNKIKIVESASIIDNNNQNIQDKIKASPLAKRIAKEHNIKLENIANNISASGPRGRIVRNDILNFINNSSKQTNNNIIARNPQESYIIKNNNIRKIIAKRLVESKQNIPHFYLSCELNIDKLLEVRATMNQSAIDNNKEQPEYKISVNDLMIKAVAMALKKVPSANSSWSEDAVIIYNNIDIAVAVAIDGGLITPIIKNADQKHIINISNEMKILAKKAREGKLQPEEFQGGSFSISNLVMYGIDNFSAIINPPQSCILAISRAVAKPIIDNNQIKIAQMMNVNLSCDHRVVDGAVGAEFLKSLRNFVENPILMLL